MNIKFKKLSPLAAVPTRATAESAGYDLYSAEESVYIKAGETKKVHIGIAIELPKDTAGFIYARSGLASKHGIAPANCVGVIDSDYRGELIVPLYNHSGRDYSVLAGERVAQLVVSPVLNVEFCEADELSGSERGTGGFGSTGKTTI